LGRCARRALVVEDDPALAKAMRKQLEEAQFDVVVASHFDAAIRHLGAREHDIACIDVQLPSRSGYELCEHIRQALKLILLPILVIGEYGHPEDMAYAEDVGGKAFLCKPFSMRQFSHCVGSLVCSTTTSRPLMHELQRLARPEMLGPTASRAGALAG
jgi:DNA-binding response OmpR family regulator